MLIGKFWSSKLFPTLIKKLFNFSELTRAFPLDWKWEIQIKVKCKRKDNKLFSVIEGLSRVTRRDSAQLDSTFIIAFLLRINFACLICQFDEVAQWARGGDVAEACCHAPNIPLLLLARFSWPAKGLACNWRCCPSLRWLLILTARNWILISNEESVTHQFVFNLIS